ncbi:hypothetical protein [Kitasatospora mediocidica]|uniref:hypothetical protein n=1 Tax=Kitasatospora mediocidica TaxID=58352 RepID=UPI00056A7335|nr:hypothetical protein [Kitasatospora mediocidica]
MATGTLCQVLVEDPILVPTFDRDLASWVAQVSDSLILTGTPVTPAVVHPIPLTCPRQWCGQDRGHLVQGRPGEEARLVCTRCATLWYPAANPDLRPAEGWEAFSRALLQTAVENADGPPCTAREEVAALRADLASGAWSPNTDDTSFSHHVVEWCADGLTLDSLTMAVFMEGAENRTPALTLALVRSAGQLAEPSPNQSEAARERCEADADLLSALTELAIAMDITA